MAATIYKTGIGLTTEFIGSQSVTHNYSVYTSQLTIAAATLLASPAITYLLSPTGL
jgi:hypothetical protein